MEGLDASLGEQIDIGFLKQLVPLYAEFMRALRMWSKWSAQRNQTTT
jgi:hypothetical protein